MITLDDVRDFGTSFFNAVASGASAAEQGQFFLDPHARTELNIAFVVWVVKAEGPAWRDISAAASEGRADCRRSGVTTLSSTAGLRAGWRSRVHVPRANVLGITDSGPLTGSAA